MLSVTTVIAGFLALANAFSSSKARDVEASLVARQSTPGYAPHTIDMPVGFLSFVFAHMKSEQCSIDRSFPS